MLVYALRQTGIHCVLSNRHTYSYPVLFQPNLDNKLSDKNLRFRLCLIEVLVLLDSEDIFVIIKVCRYVYMRMQADTE